MKVMKRKLPLGAVAMVVMLLLATLGVVYGSGWTEVLTINGTVTTGSVSAEWRVLAPKCSDNEKDGLGGPDKHVAQMTREFKGDGKLVNVTITNGYPNYEADCELEWIYTGKIPGKMDGITFIPKAGLTDCVTVSGDLPNADPEGHFTTTCNELEVEWVDGLCSQMVAGSRNAGSLFVRVLKGALEWDDPDYPEGGYSFNVEFNFVQWDKADCT